MFGIFKTNKKYENVGAAQFDELMREKNSVVLDVRTPEELNDGAVPGHKMINFFDPSFQQKVAKLDKSKTYLVYCRSGNRSGNACKAMGDMGFEKLYNLEGGISAWNRFSAA